MSEYVKLDDTVYFTANFYHPTSGFSYAADATPRWLVYESGASLILQNDMIIRNTIVGSYWGNFITSAANGFVAQRFYDVQVSGSVVGIDGFTSVKQFVLNDLYDVNVIQVSGQPVSYELIIDANMVQVSGEWVSPQSTIDANIVSVSGVGISIENFRDNVSAANVRTEMDLNSLKLTAISGSVAGLAGAAMRGTDNAALATDLNTVSGVLVARTLLAADYFDWTSDTVANVTAVATTTNLTNLASGAIADVVWDEVLSGHQTFGSTGYALNVASGNLIGETGASAQQVWEYGTRGLNVAVAVSGIVDANIVSVSGQPVSYETISDVNIVQVSGQPVSIEDFYTDLTGLDADVYYAAIKYISDVTNNADEFAVQWFKNDQVVSSGDLTVPAISVYNTNTGAAVISHQSMSYASPNLGVVRYNVTPMVLASGEPYLVETSGIIDAGLKTWRSIVGIDLL